MLDAEAGEPKKIVERKKHPQVINILKKSIRAITITKHILNLEINLTIGELLASAPAVEKQLTKLLLRTRLCNFEESSSVNA